MFNNCFFCFVQLTQLRVLHVRRKQRAGRPAVHWVPAIRQRRGQQPLQHVAHGQAEGGGHHLYQG